MGYLQSHSMSKRSVQTFGRGSEGQLAATTAFDFEGEYNEM